VCFGTWLALLTGCASQVPYAPPAPTGISSAPGTFTFRLSAGDVVAIRVWETPALDTSQRILPDGSINVPIGGRIVASGLSLPELESKLAKQYENVIQEPKVTVEVREVSATRAYFLGEIGSPGAIPLYGPTSILQGIAQVGGFNEGIADKRTIRIIRTTPGATSCPKVFGVDAAQIMCGACNDVYLQPGDVVYVHPTGLAQWSRDLRLKLEPIGTLLGPPAQAAGIILAVEAITD
jgi:polysaccharide export outer membrane protein